MAYVPTRSMMPARTGSAFFKRFNAFRMETQTVVRRIQHSNYMKRILWAVPCLALFVPFALLSQQSAPKGKVPAEEQETTIKVDVDLVNVLFTVRTKQGGLVGTLEKDDFTLVEDGKQQDIRYF